MIQIAAPPLAELYEADETAWLEAMAHLIQQGQWADLDYAHLGEYLTDMALRDRREVENRLATLLAHVLKWTYQPDRRSRSWRSTVVEQQHELARLASQGVLRNHAEAALPKTYAEALARAAAETGLASDAFPPECPYTLEQLLSAELLTE